MLITDKPENLPTDNDLDNVDDPDDELSGERAEIYLSGAHVATLDDAPDNRERITMLVDLEVFEVSVRANGDDDVPIRKCKRIGDMYLPGTQRPPTKAELAAKAAADKAAAAKVEAEKQAEAEKNQPPLYGDDGQPTVIEDQDAEPDPGTDEEAGRPSFSDGQTS